ncbi:hypothetical protein H5410_030541 [Solanum commersonii]|uniref:Uncharacterized protein n=1 Tax=Solanum commersonii TaxID=4109 RepID=A0A9J5YEK4_SOLCO|nr:hypothetical protein H5410_030541 [Solanum commersonii]
MTCSRRPTGERNISEPNIHDWVQIGGYERTIIEKTTRKQSAPSTDMPPPRYWHTKMASLFGTPVGSVVVAIRWLPPSQTLYFCNCTCTVSATDFRISANLCCPRLLLGANPRNDFLPGVFKEKTLLMLA